MSRLLDCAIVAFGVTIASDAVASSTVCGDTTLLLQVLEEREQERQQSIGLTAGGDLLELYLAPDGTWSILMTGLEGGGACIVADGGSEEAIPDVRTVVAAANRRPLVLQR